jgi:Bacterial PH domain
MNARVTQRIDGISEPLPAGEWLLWQGAPEWRATARRVFHARKLALYFAVLLAWRGASALADGAAVAPALAAALWLLPFVLCALGLAGLFAWLVSRTTVYAITSERVVMRIGIVLSVTFNIPFSAIESAGLRVYGAGAGDIVLSLTGAYRIAYLHLWPHVRPWRIALPEPMLRGVMDAPMVAKILSQALARSTREATRVEQSAPEHAPALATQPRPRAALAGC